tara:strand:- start:3383 stop:5434 length:2052 start_codon:yes stop_codon:yes gene_type:complete
MKAFPADFLTLFQMLSDDTTAEILFNIKSTNRKITNPNFDEMVNHFKEQEIDISSVYEFMEEKNLITNLLRNKTKAEKIEIRQNIAKNLEKLIEGLGQRKSRDKTQRLLNGILADDSQSRANIVALNVFLKDSTDKKLKHIKTRYLNPENRAKLIEVIEKKESKKRNFTPKDFYNEKLINLTRVLVEIRAVSGEVDENLLDDEAKESNWQTEMSGNLVILRKIVKFQRKITQGDIKKLIKDELPSLFALASTEDVKMRSISPDLRRLLYETDSSFVNIGSASRIKALATKLLESFGNVEREEIENWFKLVMEGAKTGDSRDTNFMKEITNFKINGKSMYQRILSGKENSSKHTPSFYIRKLLETPTDSNLFENVMKEMAAETILTRKDWLAWKKQSASTKEEKENIELDSKKALTTEERKAFEKEYFNATTNTVPAIFIAYMKDEGDLEITDEDYTIVNPTQAEESQKAIVMKEEASKEIQKELGQVLEEEAAVRDYKEWLKENGYSYDTNFYAKQKLTAQTSDAELQNESQLVKTIFSVISSQTETKGEETVIIEDPLRNFFIDNSLKVVLDKKSKNIKDGLAVFYHISNSMASPLVAEAQKIDKEVKKGLTVKNKTLLRAVRGFADKIEVNLKLFKSNFEKALTDRLQDIGENPINYPTIYDSPNYTNKLVSYALMKRREL